MKYPSENLFFCGDKIKDRKCGSKSIDPAKKNLKDYKFCFTLKGTC